MTRQNTSAADDDSPSSGSHHQIIPAVLRERDAARYIGLSRAYLKKARLFGRGPAFVRAKRTILYRVSDLDAWLESHVVRAEAGQ